MVQARESGVPTEVRSNVESRVLDILGICVAATQLPSSEAVRLFVTTQGGAPEAIAIGVDKKLPAASAALLNGTLAHSLDYDDTHILSVLHPSATVVPACLATAQLAGSSGRDALVAIALGLEVCVRLGVAGVDDLAKNSLYFDRGQHATSLCGSIAAAGAVATLLGLSADGVANAMSVAASMASGIIEANRTGGTVKCIHCGWAAHAAISAARMVQFGLTGPPTALEGRYGFFKAFLDGRANLSAVTQDLGSKWLVPEISFKPYPANHFCHAGIDAAAELRRRGVRAADVVSLRLGVSAPALRTVGEPIDVKRAPRSGREAQFSGPYTVAASLIGGRGLGLTLEDFAEDLVHDPFRRALMEKVEVVEDPDCTSVFPQQFAATLTAETKAGGKFTERVMVNRGNVGKPLTDRDLEVKFSENTARYLSQPESASIESAVRQLDNASSVGACLQPLQRAI
jgi:2-methylcitrate dehydratase PrpD